LLFSPTGTTPPPTRRGAASGVKEIWFAHPPATYGVICVFYLWSFGYVVTFIMSFYFIRGAVIYP
jgi:hypothetical protein